ncbi:MAG: GNAT family N-acetyltransferase [Caldilineaceae bacterium]
MAQLQPNTIICDLTSSDYASVDQLVAGLPEWFDEHARSTSIPIDIKHQRGFVAKRQDKVVGFITLYVAEGKLNIGWLGVQHDLHRQGIGRLLLAKAEAVARQLGVPELALYTLGDAVDYEPYEHTRRFYFANGFQVYQRSQTDNDGCPEEIKLSKRVA